MVDSRRAYLPPPGGGKPNPAGEHEEKAAKYLAVAGKTFDGPSREVQWANIIGGLAHSVLALSHRLGEQNRQQNK